MHLGFLSLAGLFGHVKPYFCWALPKSISKSSSFSSLCWNINLSLSLSQNSLFITQDFLKQTWGVCIIMCINSTTKGKELPNPRRDGLKSWRQPVFQVGKWQNAKNNASDFSASGNHLSLEKGRMMSCAARARVKQAGNVDRPLLFIFFLKVKSKRYEWNSLRLPVNSRCCRTWEAKKNRVRAGRMRLS